MVFENYIRMIRMRLLHWNMAAGWYARGKHRTIDLSFRHTKYIFIIILHFSIDYVKFFSIVFFVQLNYFSWFNRCVNLYVFGLKLCKWIILLCDIDSFYWALTLLQKNNDCIEQRNGMTKKGYCSKQYHQFFVRSLT